MGDGLQRRMRQKEGGRVLAVRRRIHVPSEGHGRVVQRLVSPGRRMAGREKAESTREKEATIQTGRAVYRRWEEEKGG